MKKLLAALIVGMSILGLTNVADAHYGYYGHHRHYVRFHHHGFFVRGYRTRYVYPAYRCCRPCCRFFW